MAEAIRTTVVPIRPLIRTMVVPISGVIGKTGVRIASAIGRYWLSARREFEIF